jgi:hypothetical protein
VNLLAVSELPADAIDVLRVALANMEADVAVMLAPHLDRPREVKKVAARERRCRHRFRAAKGCWTVVMK